MKKRLLSMILVLSMMLTILPVNAITAFAADDIVSGDCGPYGSAEIVASVQWSLNRTTGVLTVTGHNNMREFENSPSWYSYRTEIKEVVIEDGVTRIGAFAFRDCTNLEKITIPEGVTGIGRYAFINCTNLKKITIPEGVTGIGDEAFENSGLQSVVLPASLSGMSDFGENFKNCKSLKKVEFKSPGSLKRVEPRAFEGCTALTEVVLPDSVIDIRPEAFKDCTSLEEIVLPNSVSEIERSAFEGCNLLKKVVLPSGMYSVGEKAFAGCNLSEIYFDNTKSEWDARKIRNGYDYIKNLDTDGISFKYDGEESIPVRYLCKVNFYVNGTFKGNKNVYHTKTMSAADVPDSAKNGYALHWYTNADPEQGTEFTFGENGTPVMEDSVNLYAVYVALRTVKVPENVTVTVDGVEQTPDTNHQVTVEQGKKVTLTVNDSVYNTNYEYDWTGITGEKSTNDHGKSFKFTVGSSDVTVDLSSALRKQKFTVPDDVTVKVGDTEIQKGSDGKYEAELTKQITLTVKDPKYGDTYKWLVDGTENTADVTNDGKTLMLTVTDSLSKIELATTKYTYTVGDFDVTKPDDCTYDGQPHPATVTPKAGHGVDEGDYTVEYKKDGATDSTPDAPKDAGTYEIIIKKGTAPDVVEIPAGSFTIKPKTPGQDDFTVTLPDGVKEDAEASQKSATAEVKDDSLLKESGVTIDYSYRKVNEDGSTTKVDAPTDAGKYEYVATIKSTNPNVEGGELSWTFTIDKKAEQPGGDSGNKPGENPGTNPGGDGGSTKPGDGDNTDPAPKPEEKPDRKMKIDGGIVEVNGKEVAPDEDGNITVKEGDEITITIDKSKLSDAQVFDQWTIKPDSVLNEVDPKSEKISFKMPAETVTIEAMTRDATIEDDGPGILGTGAMIATVGISAAALGYQAHMLGTEFALRCMMPDWAVIPQNRLELAVMMWNDAGTPEPVSSNLYSDISEEDSGVQKAARWAVENELMELPDADEHPENFAPFMPVSYLDSIHAWKKAQELKK